tara:strand:- start:115 stop:246 length:132 start_codon:yes stop_codon:yes gene_type:complete
MAKRLTYVHVAKSKKKRPGVHSKNASPNQIGWKKKYKGQGKNR